ncbi:hypothetical protein GCM10007301_51490 [Azorhizobium oxalatiphilum]|uniref:Uncharacterized protein n=1 Tax=Azorhizobium oxalatiphilum TaxID=980631 RepID=A0A917CE09_9HYPH|nr:hypothetical protein GCM10007301_51490 [Azorhizobium oxalatiphilum]
MLCVAALGPQRDARAGAWTLPPGQSEFWATTSIAAAGSAFGPGYELRDGASYRKVEQNVLFEHGAMDGLTLLLGTQFLAVTITGPQRTQYAGPGYTDVGGRVRLMQGEGWVVAAQVVARAPGVGDARSRAAVGYRDWEADLRLMVGADFPLGGWPAFLDVALAQRQRFGDPPDELRLDATLGLGVMPGLLLLLQSFNVMSEGAGEGADFAVSYEYYKAQAAVLLEVNGQLSLSMAAFATVLARNFPQENGLVLAARYRF